MSTATRSAWSSAGSSTMVVESDERANTSNDCDVDTTMTAEQLLVSLDVALREDRQHIVNTILAILEKAEGDATQRFKYVCQIILIAFKRRNHEKSPAPGTGSGEKDILRTILLALYVVSPESVKAVLPLVPVYGSWKDLNLMAERYWESLPEDSMDIEGVPGLCSEIATIFADQLMKDNELMKSGVDSDSTISNRVVLPSNACKYTFSEARHRGSSRNRKAAKASRPHKIQRKLADAVSEKLFRKSDGVGVKLELRERRPLYRKFVSALRSRLTDNGFMIEHHMCTKTARLIRFNRAPKGSLEKYSAAINKDPVAKQKWLSAAKKSLSAVADINDLQEAALQAAEEEDFATEEKMLGRRIIKAIGSLESSRLKLIENAQNLLDQLTSNSSASNETLQSAIGAAAESVVIPMVDTYGCTKQEQVDTLLMSAYIIARSQGDCKVICFNGRLIPLGDAPELNFDTTTGKDGVARPTITNEAIECAMQWYTSINHERVDGWASVNRSEADISTSLREGGVSVMNSQSVPEENRGDRGARDLMLLAMFLPSDTAALTESVSFLQDLTPCGGVRSVLVHKLKAEAPSVDFKLRRFGVLPPLEQLEIDVCILMDFTGSMGSWMNAAKTHLTTIIRSLQAETRAKSVRVAFVGYRDYRDTGRVVSKDFVSMERAEEVIEAIRSQQASGGADEPEDVLSGVMAVNKLQWRGHIRACLHVADATAHGFTSSLNYSHDNHPSGLCPDQKGPGHPDLKQAVATMAEENQVDMIFCDCNPSRTGDLRNMYRGLYGSAGFGVLPLDNASKFKDTVLSALSTAVLSLHVSEDVGGLQSFGGNTLSSLISTMNTSLRESLQKVSEEVKKLDAVELDGVKETEPEVEMESGGTGEVAVEDSPAEESLVEPSVDAEKGDSNEKVEEKNTDTSSSAKASASKKPARSDYERLVSELDSQDLAPVRLLLGMPVASSLAMSAGKTLLEAGLTVADMQSLGYPPSIVQVFVEAASDSLKTV